MNETIKVTFFARILYYRWIDKKKLFGKVSRYQMLFWWNIVNFVAVKVVETKGDGGGLAGVFLSDVRCE